MVLIDRSFGDGHLDAVQSWTIFYFIWSLYVNSYKFSAARNERRNIKSKHLNTFAFPLMTKWTKRRHANQRFTIFFILYWSRAVIKFHIYDCSLHKNSVFSKTTKWCLCLGSRLRFGFFLLFIPECWMCSTWKRTLHRWI